MEFVAQGNCIFQMSSVVSADNSQVLKRKIKNIKHPSTNKLIINCQSRLNLDTK